MAVLISATSLRFAFSHRVLFEGLTFSISTGEKIALIGENGAGKSTLLKILARELEPDSGGVACAKSLRVGYLPQVPTFDAEVRVREAVYAGIENSGDWSVAGAAEEAMSRLGLKSKDSSYEESKVSELSGGWQKKVALAHELAKNPDVLFLDEPTNHLDVESVLWLEEWIRNSPICVVLVSHDRAFLRRTANRILEVDKRNPGGILSVDGDYDTYLETKAAYLEALAARQSSLSNTLRREEEWLRRGAKARTTKQQARIDRTLDLRAEVQTLNEKSRTQTVKLEFEGTDSGPRKLAELEKVSKAYGDQVLFKDLNLKITSKTRLGLMGRNGVGKSTLIKLITGDEEPTSGTLFRSEKIQVAYFEQARESLDPELSVLRTVCEYGETVEFQGRKMHVRSYLDRFLFSNSAVDVKVEKLSGGEQARLLLARLMLRPANLLILDEPTNDLDLQTLIVLEDCLSEFPGAVILVSHDREFMGEVCDQILAFPEMLTFADIPQWEKWFRSELKKRKSNDAPRTPEYKDASGVSAKKVKLSYKEQREWESMESAIHDAESKLAELETQSHAKEIVSNAAKLLKVTEEMGVIQLEIERLYTRWSELEAKIRG